MSANQPPMTMTNREGGLMGFDVDLARALAAAMRVKLDIQAMPFGELMTALEENKIDMIISGGENIYSTQVEAAIHQHPAVLESAVFGIPDDTWGEAVKAVVVLKPGQTATEEEIIAEASKHLASYQKPKSVDFVDALPKAPTGKILKRDLRDPYWQDETRQV